MLCKHYFLLILYMHVQSQCFFVIHCCFILSLTSCKLPVGMQHRLETSVRLSLFFTSKGAQLLNTTQCFRRVPMPQRQSANQPWVKNSGSHTALACLPRAVLYIRSFVRSFVRPFVAPSSSLSPSLPLPRPTTTIPSFLPPPSQNPSTRED